LSAIAGHDPADAASAESPADFDPNFAALDPDKLNGARIGVLTLSPDESQAFDDATEAIFAMAAGATAVPVSLAPTSRRSGPVRPRPSTATSKPI